jgi:FkbM family methyltransferase
MSLLETFINNLKNDKNINFFQDILLHLENMTKIPVNKNETSIHTISLLMTQTISNYIYKYMIKIFNKNHITNIPENSIEQYLFFPNNVSTHFNILKIGAFKGDNRNDKIINLMKEISEKKLKLKNIYVEPVKEYLDELIINNQKIDSNNEHIYINKAVSNVNQKLKIYKVSKNNNFNDYPWWIEQLTTSNKEHYIKHGFKDILLDEIEIDAITINDIVKEYKILSLDLLVIDTEGHDYSIVMSLDFNILRPRYIEFEYLHMTHFEYKKCIEKLEKEGYFISFQDLDNVRLIYSKF